MIWNCEHDMTQRRMISEEVADIIISWDTDDELSSDEEETVSRLLPSVSPAASSAITDSESSDENESDDESANSTRDATAGDVAGRNGTIWTSCNPVLTGRTPAHNIFNATPGVPRCVSTSISTPYSAWKMFIHESILRSIAKYTTEEAVRRGDVDFSLSLDELESFIALQYARGIYGKNHPVSFLWNRKYGIPIFRETMPRNTFTKILKYLRFDDKPNRIRRGAGADRFAPIRDVFSIFTSMCRSKYTCDFSLTVDEQLMPLKSRCSFITFMPNKPDKYGIKFWVLVDVKSKYVANITPYLGAQEKEQRGDVPLGESVVLKITEHIKGKGYNICCDNFFTSLPLAEKLQQEKLSLVGTIKKNRRDLSKVMTEPQKGSINSSNFFWHKKSGAMFVKYQPKPKKTVCLLSTMHSTPDVDTTTAAKKPCVIGFYNENKVGVDIFDQMARLYSTRSASRRWPFAVWGNILDIAAINACALFIKSTGNYISRRDFTLELIECLRHQQQNNTTIIMKPESRKRRRCYRRDCNNATTFTCSQCQNPTCGKCSQNDSKFVLVKCSGCCK